MGLTVREYAEKRGISRQAVNKAIRSGRLRKLDDGTLEPASIVEDEGHRAKVPAATTLTQVKTEHEKLKVKLTKIDLQERQGTMVPVDEVEGLFFTIFRILRDQLQTLPARLADELISLAREGTPEIAAVALRVRLEEEIADSLKETADGQHFGKDTTGERGPVRAAS